MIGLNAISTEEEARDYVRALTDDENFERVQEYVRMLLRENESQNLISARSVETLWQRHMADSAQLLEYVSRETAGAGPWLDLGTGPGLPGIVIALLRPDLRVMLVESRSRRVSFLEQCAHRLALSNCRILGQRIQQVNAFEAAAISARAFAPLPRLLDLSAPFSTDRTLYLLPKGRSAAQELTKLDKTRRKLFHVEQSLTDPEAGIIVGRLETRSGAGAC